MTTSNYNWAVFSIFAQEDDGETRAVIALLNFSLPQEMVIEGKS